MPEFDPIARFLQWANENGLELLEDKVDRLAAFEEELYAANQVMNLTRVPREECWVRHYVDSLLFHDLFPRDSSVLDIGTGPGFPAWPLAWARPDLSITAIDSNRKMLSFLESQHLPNLKVLEGRVEEWDVRERFDCVTGRALAPLAPQLEISVGPCKVAGKVMPFRTPSDDPQAAGLRTLGLKLVEIVYRKLPETAAERMLPIYEKTEPTNPKFPRRWAEIKVKPLLR
jgi:16S rRNA (guanine527-N7)-methyltransferase